MSSLQVNLEVFEGPLDLLFSLIKKNKINIYDIPISKLTDEYINSIKNIKNMEEMSEFLILATTLLQIKSKMLLPKQEEEKEEDPRKELVEKLVEYQNFKKISKLLEERAKEVGDIVFKPQDESLIKSLTNVNFSPKDVLENIDLNLLYNIFKDTIKRKESKKDVIRSQFKDVKRPVYKIENKIQYVKDLLKINKTVHINKLFEESNSKLEALVTFLAILEIVKEKNIIIIQDLPFSNIFLKRR